jgi:hypothetical protein
MIVGDSARWLTALMSTLADEENGPIWLFMDDNSNSPGRSASSS